MTLIGHAAAVTLDTPVRVVCGQAEGGRSTSVTFGAVHVSLAIASIAHAEAAARTSWSAVAITWSWASLAIIRGSPSSIALVTWLADFTGVASGMVCTVLEEVPI